MVRCCSCSMGPTGRRWWWPTTSRQPWTWLPSADSTSSQSIEGRHVSLEASASAALSNTWMLRRAEGPLRRRRHGYAGTIYRGQGRTLDQTYLYHSEHWRSAASYVALTRHRDKAELFVATNTARDVTELARQMARVDNRRAASQFYQLGQGTGPVRPLTAKELLTK